MPDRLQNRPHGASRGRMRAAGMALGCALALALAAWWKLRHGAQPAPGPSRDDQEEATAPTGARVANAPRAELPLPALPRAQTSSEERPRPTDIQAWLAQQREMRTTQLGAGGDRWRDLPHSRAGDAGADAVGESAQARWEREPPDRAWTDQLKRDLEQTLDDLTLDGEVEEVACRTSVCRVKLSLERVEDALTLAHAAGDPAQREQARYRLHEAGIDLEVFVSRGRPSDARHADADFRPVP